MRLKGAAASPAVGGLAGSGFLAIDIFDHGYHHIQIMLIVHGAIYLGRHSCLYQIKKLHHHCSSTGEQPLLHL